MDAAIMKQTVHTMVMLGWSKFDKGAKPPPIEYLHESHLHRYISRKESAKLPTKDEQRWDTIVAEYDFGQLDEYDIALLRFVDSSVLDPEEIHRRDRLRGTDAQSLCA